MTPNGLPGLWALVGEVTASGFLEAGLAAFGFGLTQYGGIHGGHNVAEIVLAVDRLISRNLLRPLKGSGWQPG
jgi:hypothetical protein